MQRTNIPNTTLEVSRLCFGCGNLGTGATGNTALTLVNEYFAVGGNFFDTAHCYAFWEPNGTGASERELGRCLRQLNILQESVIATKGGHPSGPGYPRPDNFLAPSVLMSDIAESRDRLGVETIHLYFLHRDDGKTPVSEIMDCLNTEIGCGHIRYLGASNWSVERIAEANAYAAQHGLRGFVVSQIQWSLCEPNGKTETPEPDPIHRTVGTKEFAFHRETGLPIAAFSATAGGYFADNPKANPLYDNPTNRIRRERARKMAAELGVTPQQVALAWLLHQDVTVYPLFATTNPQHLKEILDAARIDLTSEQRDGLIQTSG